MSETLSKSPKPDDHMRTRQEKDDSYSTGAGRKAVEKPVDSDGTVEDCDAKDSSAKACSKKDPIEAPIGLDNETRGDCETH